MVSFHATCAQRKGLIRDINLMEELKGSKKAPPVYCKAHLEKESPSEHL